MTYEEIVEKMRECFEPADARNIYEHCAMQVNVEGEGAGIFYIEIANREISVEPYDYYDKDVLLTVQSNVLLAMLDGRLSSRAAYTAGLIDVKGSMEKALLFENIVFKGKDEICLGKRIRDRSRLKGDVKD